MRHATSIGSRSNRKSNLAQILIPTIGRGHCHHLHHHQLGHRKSAVTIHELAHCLTD